MLCSIAEFGVTAHGQAVSDWLAVGIQVVMPTNKSVGNSGAGRNIYNSFQIFKDASLILSVWEMCLRRVGLICSTQLLMSSVT